MCAAIEFRSILRGVETEEEGEEGLMYILSSLEKCAEGGDDG